MPKFLRKPLSPFARRRSWAAAFNTEIDGGSLGGLRDVRLLELELRVSEDPLRDLWSHEVGGW